MACLMKVARSRKDGKEFELIRAKLVAEFAPRSTASYVKSPEDLINDLKDEFYFNKRKITIASTLKHLARPKFLSLIHISEPTRPY